MNTVTVHRIEPRIQLVRGVKVIIDADLAALYGVPTKRLNEQVKRNIERFPPDFLFQLTAIEKAEVVANCDHLAKLKFSRTLPYAFTEHGAIQAANVLASSQAVEMGATWSCQNGWMHWKRKPAFSPWITTSSAATPGCNCGSCSMRCANSRRRQTRPSGRLALCRPRTKLHPERPRHGASAEAHRLLNSSQRFALHRMAGTGFAVGGGQQRATTPCAARR